MKSSYGAEPQSRKVLSRCGMAAGIFFAFSMIVGAPPAFAENFGTEIAECVQGRRVRRRTFAIATSLLNGNFFRGNGSGH